MLEYKKINIIGTPIKVNKTSNPIAMNKTLNQVTKQYSLHYNLIDNTPNSPPSEWKARLMKRINEN
jgi:hypothetical protein